MGTLKTVYSRSMGLGEYRFVAVAFSDLQLLDEKDLRAVLALAHVPAGFDGLLEREEARRCPAAIAREP